jgi:hypothetical protein
MDAETVLVRNPRDRRLPRSLLEPERRENHRPRVRYRLVLHDAGEAEEARAHGIPVYAIPDSVVTMLGYPMRFPTLLVVPRGVRAAVTTELPIIEFVSDRAVAHPRLEDVFVAMLRFDVLAARALIQRNVEWIDRDYLLKRIFQEDLEEEATRVRLQDFLPLPPKGEPLPRRALERAASANRPRSLIP